MAMMGRMHYTRVDLGGGAEAHVNHNSDWSGNVRISWEENGEKHEVWVPGVVLQKVGVAAAHRAIVGRLIAALEDMKLPA